MKTNYFTKSNENLKSAIVELNKKEMESIQGGGSYIIQRGDDGIPVLHWIP